MKLFLLLFLFVCFSSPALEAWEDFSPDDLAITQSLRIEAQNILSRAQESCGESYLNLPYTELSQFLLEVPIQWETPKQNLHEGRQSAQFFYPPHSTHPSGHIRFSRSAYEEESSMGLPPYLLIHEVAGLRKFNDQNYGLVAILYLAEQGQCLSANLQARAIPQLPRFFETQPWFGMPPTRVAGSTTIGAGGDGLTLGLKLSATYALHQAPARAVPSAFQGIKTAQEHRDDLLFELLFSDLVLLYPEVATTGAVHVAITHKSADYPQGTQTANGHFRRTFNQNWSLINQGLGRDIRVGVQWTTPIENRKHLLREETMEEIGRRISYEFLEWQGISPPPYNP